MMLLRCRLSLGFGAAMAVVARVLAVVAKTLAVRAEVLAAVAKDGTITILDPAKMRRKREAKVGQDAEIANLLQWLDATDSEF